MATLVYKCPNCYSSLQFDATTQKLVCEYCDSTFTVEEAENSEVNQHSDEKAAFIEKPDGNVLPADETLSPEDSMAVYSHICPNCGAALMGDVNTAATFCAYCGNPTLNEAILTSARRPARIIPFKQTKKEAQEAFLAWGKQGFLTPSDFTSSATLNKITGIYVPFWLFNCTTHCDYTGNAIKTYTKLNGTNLVQVTDDYTIKRSFDSTYTAVPADASKNMDDNTMDLLEPFDVSELVPFKMAYLSGFFAEKYTYTAKDLVPRMENRLKEFNEQAVKDDCKGAYTTIKTTKNNLKVLNANAEYVMLPVWLLRYRYKDKMYEFAMNGQTGQMVGTRPVSSVKQVLAFSLIYIVAFIVLLLIGLILIP